jgi:hypothetical protein
LGFDLFDAPDVRAVEDEVGQLVGAVEAGAGAVVFFCAQDDNRVVGEG